MRDFDWPESGPNAGAVSLIMGTWSVRDFANFGNRWLRAIPRGRKTDPLARKRFRVFGKRDTCAISLIPEIMADARFHLAGKRNHFPENDPLI